MGREPPGMILRSERTEVANRIISEMLAGTGFLHEEDGRFHRAVESADIVMWRPTIDVRLGCQGDIVFVDQESTFWMWGTVVVADGEHRLRKRSVRGVCEVVEVECNGDVTVRPIPGRAQVHNGNGRLLEEKEWTDISVHGNTILAVLDSVDEDVSGLRPD